MRRGLDAGLGGLRRGREAGGLRMREAVGA